jgi:hypothetical protein
MKQLLLFLLVFPVIVSTAFSQAANTGTGRFQVQFDSLFQKALVAYRTGKIDEMPVIYREMLPLAQKTKSDSALFRCNYLFPYSPLGVPDPLPKR